MKKATKELATTSVRAYPSSAEKLRQMAFKKKPRSSIPAIIKELLENS